MDNSVDLPGYKYYVDAGTGDRPDAFVTFLNLVRDEASTVNGVAFPVDEQELPLFDARERNYERRDVSDAIPLGGRVWTYVGSTDSRARFERGRVSGTAVVDAAYLRAVREAFDALGTGERERFEHSTDPPEVPVRELRRVELD